MVLIDSGSTHNFIRLEVAEKLKLPVQATQPFHVYIGNGDSLLCQFHCPQTALNIQGNELVADLYVLQIQGLDIVLGVQWLQELGKVTNDFKQLTMEFRQGNKTMQFRGDVLLTAQPISFNQLQVMVGFDYV